MGGFTAIGGASLAGGAVAAVVAVCPATEDGLLRGLRNDRLEGFEADRETIEPWLESVSIRDAAASLAPDTALMLMHAKGDEQVPYTVSEELYAAAGDPKRLLIVPGGHHRSLQHDMEMQAASLRFVQDAVRRRARA
jgi:fermentation-respiration switch protein FrsA (DUF1100 family)